MKLKSIKTAITLLLLIFVFSCKQEKKQIEIKKVRYEKPAKKEGVRYKKGVEYMADYFKEISSNSLEDRSSSYKPGFILEEFEKSKALAKRKGRSKKSPNAVFTERGPTNVPGRTRGIAVDPTNKRRWFVGTVGGGVWLTEDEGASWTNLTDTKIPNLGTSVIVISPQDPNTLYVGTGEPFGNLGAIGGSGVFKTVDGGSTWVHLTQTENLGDVGRMIIDPNNKDIVVMGTQRGIYRTTDGGTTWTQTYNSNNSPVQDVDADPNDFNIQYGSVRNFGVVKSTDGGQNWSTIFDRNNFNASHQRFELDVSPADSNFIYLGVYTPNSAATTAVNTDFYVSKDGGASFTLLTPSLGASASNLISGQGWYDNIIMAHPYDTSSFYVGGIAVFKVGFSENNIFGFQSIASGYDNSQINTGVHVDQHGMEYILGDNQEFRILLANDGGAYSTNFSTDPGTRQGDWSNDNISKNSTQFYGATKQNGQDNYIAGAQDNGSWISFDNDASATKTYTSISGGDGFEVLWHYKKPGNFISTIQFNRIVRYINNNGALSDFTSSGNSGISPFYSKVSNADNNPDVVFAVDRNGVWRSTDFAGSWEQTRITDNFAQNATSALNVEVSVANPDVVWAGSAMTESGSFVLHYSTDNGVTFNKAGVYDNPNGTHNLNISGIGTSPTEEKRAYALFSSGGRPKVLKTEDMGATWTDISGFETGENNGFPDVKVHCILEMPYDKNVIWVGTDIGLVETLDGGVSWNLRTDFIPVAIYEMRIVNDQVVFATYGRGVWSGTLPELNGYQLPPYFSEPDVAVRQEGIQSQKAVVSYEATSDDVTRAKYFVDGVEVSEVIQNFDAGVNYEFDTSVLPEGKHTIGVQLFDDNNSRSTEISEAEVEIVDYNDPASNLAIASFADSDIYAFDSAFKIDNSGGAFIESNITNTNNPYENNANYSFVLRQPLSLSFTNNLLNYTDIAIVEPFDNPSSDLNQFYDFVTIEASTDLQTWITLDKYDARRFSDWLQAYSSNSTLNFGLFKTQSINLTDKGLIPGQDYVFRFRLVSDGGVTSKGWFVKSINAAAASIQEVLQDDKSFTVYPTISKGNFTIFGNNNLGDSKVQIVDVTGKEVYKGRIDFTSRNEHKLNINLRPGVYLLNLTGSSKQRITEKIIIE
ncbi:MAG: hypothetical protein CMB99_12900 [Flavobacteriaceae bacterium]|nr:hypothetical protein [Flavobacteriaceae bacterium]|tara:strand:- start:60074 stop:63532 length:3459 start_codon:yes stop_codon:yes gene_type:complete